MISTNHTSETFPILKGIAVRAHLGWNHREQAGSARYCLAVTFEALDIELPVYEQVEEENRVEIETETRVRIVP